MEILKAQLYQESRLDPHTVSYVGAEGLGQFMPDTWAEVSDELGFDEVSVYSPAQNIEATAYYMAGRLNVWKSPRAMSDRLSLAWACYNAGCGWILKAQKLCGDPASYKDIIKCLPQVTGSHSTETKNYVQRIWRYWIKMRMLT